MLQNTDCRYKSKIESITMANMYIFLTAVILMTTNTCHAIKIAVDQPFRKVNTHLAHEQIVWDELGNVCSVLVIEIVGDVKITDLNLGLTPKPFQSRLSGNRKIFWVSQKPYRVSVQALGESLSIPVNIDSSVGHEYSLRIRATHEFGSVIFHTIPEQVTIDIDQETVPMINPGIFHYENVAGTYHARVSHECYEPVSCNFRINPSAKDTIHIELVSKFIPVTFYRNPETSVLYVDDMEVGIIDSTQLVAGKHTILAMAKGYQDSTINIDIDKNQPYFYSFILKEKPTKLIVQCTPSDAELSLYSEKDDEPFLSWSGNKDLEVDPGEYRLVVGSKKPEYLDHQESITIQRGEILEYSISLKKKRPTIHFDWPKLSKHHEYDLEIKKSDRTLYHGKKRKSFVCKDNGEYKVSVHIKDTADPFGIDAWELHESFELDNEDYTVQITQAWNETIDDRRDHLANDVSMNNYISPQIGYSNCGPYIGINLAEGIWIKKFGLRPHFVSAIVDVHAFITSSSNAMLMCNVSYLGAGYHYWSQSHNLFTSIELLLNAGVIGAIPPDQTSWSFNDEELILDETEGKDNKYTYMYAIPVRLRYQFDYRFDHIGIFFNINCFPLWVPDEFTWYDKNEYNQVDGDTSQLEEARKDRLLYFGMAGIGLRW